MDITQLLEFGVEHGASDCHLSAGERRNFPGRRSGDPVGDGGESAGGRASLGTAHQGSVLVSGPGKRSQRAPGLHRLWGQVVADMPASVLPRKSQRWRPHSAPHRSQRIAVA